MDPRGLGQFFCSCIHVCSPAGELLLGHHTISRTILADLAFIRQQSEPSQRWAFCDQYDEVVLGTISSRQLLACKSRSLSLSARIPSKMAHLLSLLGLPCLVPKVARRTAWLAVPRMDPVHCVMTHYTTEPNSGSVAARSRNVYPS